MSAQFTLLPAAGQESREDAPYDRWVNPAGETIAEFYREPAGFVVRLLDQADFAFLLGGAGEFEQRQAKAFG